jgi:hypothetical protein
VFCLSNVSYYPRLTAELGRRGWTKPELRGLFGQVRRRRGPAFSVIHAGELVIY